MLWFNCLINNFTKLFSGTCKVDDLFQYADNKDKFTKSVRRKFFQEGLQELEEDLKNDPGANNSLGKLKKYLFNLQFLQCFIMM